MNNQTTSKSLPVFRGELALLVAVAINSFGVVLMLYSGTGISAISSVPYAFSLRIFGSHTWHLDLYFPGTSGADTDDPAQKFVPQYLFSFVVGFVFGELLDVHEMWINVLPTAIGWRVLYFVASYILICIGIALSNRCQMPIVPTDLFQESCPRSLPSPTEDQDQL